MKIVLKNNFEKNFLKDFYTRFDLRFVRFDFHNFDKRIKN